jgi:hypothetical protein
MRRVLQGRTVDLRQPRDVGFWPFGDEFGASIPCLLFRGKTDLNSADAGSPLLTLAMRKRVQIKNCFVRIQFQADAIQAITQVFQVEASKKAMCGAD